MSTSALSYFKHFYPQAQFTPETERVVLDTAEFFRQSSRAPVQPSFNRGRGPPMKPLAPTHYNYLNANSWYGKGGYFITNANALVELNRYVTYFFNSGCPLFLVEKLGEKFKFFLDVDIVMDPSSGAVEIEKTMLDEQGGYRLLLLMSQTLEKLFPAPSKTAPSPASKLLLFSATGPGKISWRVVFPNLVVDGKIASKARNALVESLSLASFKESTTPWFRDLLTSLKCLNPENEWRNVLDESVLSGKFGIRQVLCDKLNSNGDPEGRPMRPVIAVKDGLSTMEVEKVVNSSADLQWFFDLGSVRVPDSIPICQFKGDAVKRSRMTRTGPGGSCVDVARFSEQIAERVGGGRRTETQVSLDLVFRGPLEALIEKLSTTNVGRWTRHDANNATWAFENKMSIDFKFGRVTVKAVTANILEPLKQIVLKAGCVAIGGSTGGSDSPSSSNSTVGSVKKIEVLKSFYSQSFAVGKGQTGLEVLRIEGPQVLILKKGDGTQGWVPTAHLLMIQ